MGAGDEPPGIHPAGHAPLTGQGTPPGDGAGAGDVPLLGGSEGSHPAGHAPLAGHGTPPSPPGVGAGDVPAGIHPAGHAPLAGQGTPFGDGAGSGGEPPFPVAHAGHGPDDGMMHSWAETDQNDPILIKHNKVNMANAKRTK